MGSRGWPGLQLAASKIWPYPKGERLGSIRLPVSIHHAVFLVSLEASCIGVPMNLLRLQVAAQERVSI